MNDLSRSVNLDYQSLRNSEANQPGVHRTMSLFVNTGEQDRKLFVCCRSDDTIRNLCQAIANIYYETFLAADKGDKAPNDDYYYDKVNNNVVTVDHLSLNGFTLPFQHKVGDLLENRAMITASITTSKKSKKTKSVKVEEDSQVKRRVGRPKKTPVESETPSVAKDDKKSKAIRVKREEDESLQKDVEREEEIKKKLKTETGAAKSRQASKQEKELLDIIENIDEKAKKGVNEKEILKKQGKASKEEVTQTKKISRKDTGASEAGIAVEGKKTPVVPIVQPQDEGKKTPVEGKRTPVEGKRTPVPGNEVKQDTLKMMIEELEDDDLKIVPKKKPAPVVEKVEKQEPKGKPKKIFQGSSDESEEEERIKTPAMDSSRRVSRRGTKDQMVLEEMINKSEEKAKKNTLAAPLIPRKKSSIFVGDSDEDEKPVVKQQQQVPPKQVNGKKEAIFLDSSDEETPLKAPPKKSDEGFQKFQKKSEDIIAPLNIPEKTIEKVPTEPSSAASKKGKPKENGPQASRKASESETKKNKEMEEEKETEALFNEMYKKKPAPEDVENGPTQVLPTMEEDPLKVPVLSIHHFEPKGKPLPKKKVPSGNESDSGAKPTAGEAESETAVKQGKPASKQNGKHGDTKKADKPKEEKETNKGKAKSAQKPPLKLRKASIDLSKSSGSNLMSPTEAVNLHEGLQQGLAKLSKKPATTGKSESKPMPQSQKKAENTKKNEKAKLEEDTSETSSDSELELYKKKPVTKNVNLFL